MNHREAMTHHRRGLSINGILKDSDDLDLISRPRHISDESQVSVKLGRLSLGSARPVKNPLDDLLTSIDSGKHDYDWLLTPPETPLCPSSDGNDYLQAVAPPRSSSSVRTVSTTKSSRLSNSQSESNQTGRLSRSNSLTRQSASSFQYNSYSNKSTNILNTSSASVSSYMRPSTPSRSSSTRPSTPTSRSTSSRPSTPSRARPAPSTSSIDRSRPSQTSRSSTPNSRPQVLAANLSSQGVRSTSRPSTPTRRNSAPSMSLVSGSSTSISRASSNVRNVPSVSRPNSPGPRARSVPSVPQPIVLPDFSLDTPPNLRTTLPERPLSAGRSRPGAGVNIKSTTDAPSLANPPRRQPSPIGTRGRSAEPSARSRISNGQPNHVSESHMTSHVSDSSSRKPLKASADSTGFGRTISKRSLDMAIRHMDIKSGANGVRGIPGSNLFPQSVRSASVKSQATHTVHPPSYATGNSPYRSSSDISKNGNNKFDENKSRISAKLSNVDIFESSRYDTMLLKEDLKNTSWLHCLDDKTDQESIFDSGFESLPEPFDPL